MTSPGNVWPLHVDASIGGDAVVTVLAQLATSPGLPPTITTDNGPEFTGRVLHLWAQAANVSINHIQPGKPMQNAFIERFNGSFRDDCHNQHWFGSPAEARVLIEHWRHEYNHLHLHSSIGRIPPNSFALIFPPNVPHSHTLSSKLGYLAGGQFNGGNSRQLTPSTNGVRSKRSCAPDASPSTTTASRTLSGRPPWANELFSRQRSRGGHR